MTPDKPELSPELTYLREHGLVFSNEPKAAEALQRTFEQMGGTQRMLLWADKYPASFYKLYARMVIPTIAPVLPIDNPTSSKDDWPEWVTARRLAYQEEALNAVSKDITAQSDNPENDDAVGGE